MVLPRRKGSQQAVTQVAAAVEALDPAEPASDDEPSARILLASERPGPTPDLIDPYEEDLLTGDEQVQAMVDRMGPLDEPEKA